MSPIFKHVFVHYDFIFPDITHCWRVERRIGQLTVRFKRLTHERTTVRVFDYSRRRHTRRTFKQVVSPVPPYEPLPLAPYSNRSRVLGWVSLCRCRDERFSWRLRFERFPLGLPAPETPRKAPPRHDYPATVILTNERAQWCRSLVRIRARKPSPCKVYTDTCRKTVERWLVLRAYSRRR